MKALVVAFAFLLATSASAQQRPPAPAPTPAPAPAPQQATPAQTCISQHVEAPGMSVAALMSRGYDIKAAVPGGLWVQKDREVYFCNTGRALDNEALCWRLREPVKGQPCQ